MKPTQRRAAVHFLRVGFQISERRACRVIAAHRRTMRYRSRKPDQAALAPADQRTRCRARSLRLSTHPHLVASGGVAGERQASLSALSRGRALAALKTVEEARERPTGSPATSETTERALEHRFPADSLADGRPFRVFTVVDNVSRVSPAIEVAFSLRGEAVVVVLGPAKGWRTARGDWHRQRAGVHLARRSMPGHITTG